MIAVQAHVAQRREGAKRRAGATTTDAHPRAAHGAEDRAIALPTLTDIPVMHSNRVARRSTP